MQDTHCGDREIGWGMTGKHDAVATTRSERGTVQFNGCYVPSMGKCPHKWTASPTAAVGEGFPTAGMGCPSGCIWRMVRVIALLCGPDTEE